MCQLMQRGDQKWKIYKAYNYELPTEEELKSLKVITIPGSPEAVYDTTLPWLPNLEEFIKTVYYNYTHIKLFGVCFGE